jgi:2-polyprenyl-3-methyl-5-hydroxy-6-metoxy-1,4-benzoquinol methylase
MKNRGKNTFEHWNAKHIQEYGVFDVYDHSQIDKSPLSYHKVAYDLMKENIDAIKIKSMLEIGCAVGYFSSYIAIKFPDWKVEGWDFSKSGIDAAREKNKHLNNISFKIVDILETPVTNDYGIISCFETIEHMAEGDNYRLLNNWLEHCEYLILSTVDTEDDCQGEHISHYKIDTLKNKGYQVVWEAYLSPINMPTGIFHYFINLIKGKL